MTEHSRKMLLRLEATGYSDIQDTRLDRTIVAQPLALRPATPL